MQFWASSESLRLRVQGWHRSRANRSGLFIRLYFVTRFLLGLVAVSAWGQTPRVGEIEIYGLRTLTADKILAAAKVKPGDPIPPSKGDLQDRIADLPGVVLSRVEAVCCQGDKVTLFIGI